MPPRKTSPKADKPAAVTLEALGLTRILRARIAPSGNRYDIRPMNLERFALSGGLPARLRAVAVRGIEGVNELLSSKDDETLTEQGRDAQDWIDRLVAEVIVTPSLFAETKDADGLKQVDPERIELIPPVDYKWALLIALGECDTDAEGARLWGREPLSRWATFREEHSCPPDCESCSRVVDAFSAAI